MCRVRLPRGRRAGLFRTQREAAIKYARAESVDGNFTILLQPEGLEVVRPNGGWSKGRPIAFIEERGTFRLAELLIPNDLSEPDLERYLADKFSTFAKAGRAIRRLDARPSTNGALASAQRL